MIIVQEEGGLKEKKKMVNKVKHQNKLKFGYLKKKKVKTLKKRDFFFPWGRRTKRAEGFDLFF